MLMYGYCSDRTGLQIMNMEVFGHRKGDNQPIIKQQRRQVNLCQPCQCDGDSVEAEAFCETCNEFICHPCLKVHRKLSMTKNHVIKSKNEMPLTSNKERDPCSELCSIHKTEIVKFYCDGHNFVGCGDCMVLNHKSCSVKLVCDVSKNYNTSGELKLIKKKIESLQRKLSSYQDEIENDIKSTEKTGQIIIREIKLFRDEINKYLDNVETDLLKEVDHIKKKQVSHLMPMKQEIETMEIEMKECQNKIYQTSGSISQLFVVAKLSQEKIKACHMSTERLTSECEIEILHFSRSKEFLKLIANTCPMGMVGIQKRKLHSHKSKSLIDVQTKLLKNLTPQAPNDRYQCYISGMAVISCDELLLVDNSNSSLKLLNVKEDKITSIYRTDSDPYDTTFIDSRTSAVTITKGEILFVSASNRITKSHSIKIRKGCWGIDYRDGVLAVSFLRPASVQLLDIKGTIMHEFDITTQCSRPYYIVLSIDNKSFIVSDWSHDVMFDFGVDGTLKAKITSDEIKATNALLRAQDGTIIVCCQDISDRLNMVTPNTSEILPLM